MLLSSPRNDPKEIIHSRAASSEKTRDQILTQLHQFGPHVLSPASEEGKMYIIVWPSLLSSPFPTPQNSSTQISFLHPLMWLLQMELVPKQLENLSEISSQPVHWEDFSLQRSHWDRFADDPLILEGERCVTDGIDVMEFILARDSVLLCSRTRPFCLSNRTFNPTFAHAVGENWGLKPSVAL